VPPHALTVNSSVRQEHLTVGKNHHSTRANCFQLANAKFLSHNHQLNGRANKCLHLNQMMKTKSNFHLIGLKNYIVGLMRK
jgi:hypothetical protein